MSDDIQVKRVLWLYLPKSTAKRVVLLTGARQTGKTTLSKSAYPDLRYINLDAPENRDALKAISTSTWGRDVGNAVIDEARRCRLYLKSRNPPSGPFPPAGSSSANPDISRVEVVEAATQRMRPDRLVRRVKILRNRSSFALENLRGQTVSAEKLA